MEESRHEPVMLAEVLEWLGPEDGRTILDLNLGGGGHSRAFLDAGAKVLALDWDPEAVRATRERLRDFGDRFEATVGGLGEFGEALDSWGIERVDGIFMDLGLSSDQLDDADRGFAFRLEGPLDLRFDRNSGIPASQFLADTTEPALCRVLAEFGEIRRPRRLARRMLDAAASGELETTSQLASLVRTVTPGHKKPEPELARVFQALRLAVGGELEQLDAALAQVVDRLLPAGRFVCLAYHSLEDKRVKHMLRDEGGLAPRGSRHLPDPVERPVRMQVLTRRPLRPGQEEIERNPRARSARLRAGERR